MKILIFVVFLFCQTSLWASVPMDIVFDIDQTIATLVHEGPAGDLLAPSGKVANVQYLKEEKDVLGNIKKIPMNENYRVYDGLPELLQELKNKHEKGLIRVSFYSGSQRERTISLLEKITLPDGSSAKELAYKVFGREEMVATGAGSEARMRDRFKKELTKINPILDDVVMVDDIKDFVPDAEKSHVLWLDEKFPYPERVDKALGQVDPQILKREREKMKWIGDHLLSGIDERVKTGRPLAEIMRKKTLDGVLTPFSPGEEKSYERGQSLFKKYKKPCFSLDQILSFILQ